MRTRVAVKARMLRVTRATMAIALAASFVAGVIVARCGGVREARAQPAAASIIVPPQGLVFRSTDGRALARLASDADGGVFELYDAREQVAARLRVGSATGALEIMRPLGSRRAIAPSRDDIY
jgi:hypothetical protein